MQRMTSYKSRQKSFKLINNPIPQDLHQCAPEIGKNAPKNWLLLFYKNSNNENIVHSSNKRVWRCYKCNRLFSFNDNKFEKINVNEINNINWSGMVDKKYMKEQDIVKYQELIKKDNK